MIGVGRQSRPPNLASNSDALIEGGVRGIRVYLPDEHTGVVVATRLILQVPSANLHYCNDFLSV
jgi:hypothetical protein